MKKPFRLIVGAPGPDAREAISSAKAVLRRHDLRAVALITVNAEGVSTLYGGADEGFYHHLVSGAEQLKYRIMKDAGQ